MTEDINLMVGHYYSIGRAPIRGGGLAVTLARLVAPNPFEPGAAGMASVVLRGTAAHRCWQEARQALTAVYIDALAARAWGWGGVPCQ